MRRRRRRGPVATPVLSWQREAGDRELGMRDEVDRAVVVRYAHMVGIADDERQGAARLRHALGALGIERGHQHALVRVLHFDPGLFLAADHQAVYAGGHFCDAGRGGLLHRARPLGGNLDRSGLGTRRLLDGLRLRSRRARHDGWLRAGYGALFRGALGGELSGRVVFAVPLVGDDAAQAEHGERHAEIHEGRAARAVRERHRLAVARGEVIGIGGLEAAGDRLEQRLGLELQEPRVAAHHAAHEGAARQEVEALLLERLELPRREFELLRNFRDRQPARFARRLQPGPYGFGHRELSHIPPAATTGIRASPGSAAAAGWRSSAPRRARPACVLFAGRATAIRSLATPACYNAKRACARRRYYPADSGSGRAAA